MNCPHCNSPSAEGKKYCADCGTPLDPQTKQLEALVKTKVEEFFKANFQDQKAVEIKTSQAVVERVHGWAKLFGFFIGLPFAALLIMLSVGGIQKYSDFKRMIDSVQDQVKPRVEQAKSDAEHAQRVANEAKVKAEEARRTTESVTAQVSKQLGSAAQLTKNVQALSARVSELEKQTSSQMRASTQHVEGRVTEIDQKIDAASKDIAEQQKKLASTNELVKALFSKGMTEYFQTKVDAQNVVILSAQERCVRIYVAESCADIPNDWSEVESVLPTPRIIPHKQ